MNKTLEETQPIGRLKKRADFLRLNKLNQKWITPSFVLQTAKNESDELRFGLTVTKKTSARAVERNRIKRRLRALAMERLAPFANAGHDYVFIGRKDALTISYDKMKKDLRWALKRLECLK